MRRAPLANNYAGHSRGDYVSREAFVSFYISRAALSFSYPRVSSLRSHHHFLHLSNRIVYRFEARLVVALGGFQEGGISMNEAGLPIWVFRVGVHAPLICATNRPLPFCSRRRKSFARERKISNYTNGARYFLRSSNLANKRNFISQANFFLIDSIG